MSTTLSLDDLVRGSVDDAVRVLTQLRSEVEFISELGQLLAKTFSSGNKLIVAGNGGSLSDASHFAEELTGFFRKRRRALPAISIAEPGHLTCTGNDAGFDEVFARGVEAYGQPGDLFVGLTTSGNSQNLIRAFEEAKNRGLVTVAFLGKGGGKLRGVANHELLIDAPTSDRVQEAHMAAIHIAIEAMEELLFD
jgi:D-sedoheptulose 7-phosphate isomerase